MLGSSKHLVVPLDNGTIAHAQLVLDDGVIMLGSVRDDDYGRLTAPPGPDGANTQSASLMVDDPAGVLERAVAAGAEIVVPLQHPEYGGALFACRDPDRHV